MEVAPSWGFAAAYDEKTYYFCTTNCRDRFVESPEDFLADRCVVCDEPIDGRTPVTATYLDKTYQLCSLEHRVQFKADPASFFMHTMWGIPPWMYYISIAVVLVVSFGVFKWAERWTGVGIGSGPLRVGREKEKRGASPFLRGAG
jgi:YHS domain-containing protein